MSNVNMWRLNKLWNEGEEHYVRFEGMESVDPKRMSNVAVFSTVNRMSSTRIIQLKWIGRNSLRLGYESYGRGSFFPLRLFLICDKIRRLHLVIFLDRSGNSIFPFGIFSHLLIEKLINVNYVSTETWCRNWILRLLHSYWNLSKKWNEHNTRRRLLAKKNTNRSPYICKE